MRPLPEIEKPPKLNIGSYPTRSAKITGSLVHLPPATSIRRATSVPCLTYYDAIRLKICASRVGLCEPFRLPSTQRWNAEEATRSRGTKQDRALSIPCATAALGRLG